MTRRSADAAGRAAQPSLISEAESKRSRPSDQLEKSTPLERWMKGLALRPTRLGADGRRNLSLRDMLSVRLPAAPAVFGGSCTWLRP